MGRPHPVVQLRRVLVVLHDDTLKLREATGGPTFVVASLQFCVKSATRAAISGSSACGTGENLKGGLGLEEVASAATDHNRKRRAVEHNAGIFEY